MEGWRCIGLCGPALIDADGTVVPEPYGARSIELVPVVLRPRVADCLVFAVDGDKGKDGEEDENEVAMAAPIPVPAAGSPVPGLDTGPATTAAATVSVAGVGAAELEPRDEAPRLSVWAGAAWLISFSRARPGLMVCLGSGCGLADGSWTRPALAELSAGLSLLLWGG